MKGIPTPRPQPADERAPTLPAAAGDPRPVLITGGAGFIGTNVADRLARAGHRVTVFDNLSRPGVERNAQWLRATHGDKVRILHADVTDAHAVDAAVADASHVFHFAAQVAVTTSLADPRHDFDTNLRGTLNVLEASRALPPDRRPPLLFTSTNKVYGDLRGLHLTEFDGRYAPTHDPVKRHGFAEGWLDFHSPYGCSKGGADQYVIDYARSFGMPNVVFRMSCIYGPHQCGTEDQGWVAHFLMAAMRGQPITLYGDGKQVRDVLHVDDLTRAMILAIRHLDQTRGRAFNMGGGPRNAVSLRRCIELIGQLRGRDPDTRFGPWRRGDQRYYVSDTRAFEAVTGWAPAIGYEEGIARLHQWLAEHADDPAERHPRHHHAAAPATEIAA